MNISRLHHLSFYAGADQSGCILLPTNYLYVCNRCAASEIARLNDDGDRWLGLNLAQGRGSNSEEQSALSNYQMSIGTSIEFIAS